MSRQSKKAPHTSATESRTAAGHVGAGSHPVTASATIASMSRPCGFEGVAVTDREGRRARARSCRCDLCVEARSFAVLGLANSGDAAIDERIGALMWRPALG